MHERDLLRYYLFNPVAWPPISRWMVFYCKHNADMRIKFAKRDTQKRTKCNKELSLNDHARLTTWQHNNINMSSGLIRDTTVDEQYVIITMNK